MVENNETLRARPTAASQAKERARALATKTTQETPTFLRYLLARFQADGCTEVAASLSYTSLLAIVPLLAIGLSMFAAFSGFSELRDNLLQSLFTNLAPDLWPIAQQYLDTFMSNAAETTGVGVLGLAVTAILLIHTIQVAFDRIWGSASHGWHWHRFPVYWALITLGPILFGISFSISTYFFRTADETHFLGVSTGVRILASFMPFFLETIGFALFYRLMPTRPVRLPDAVFGAITAALLFELVKHLFGLYLHYVPTYQALYGALATIPIFLLWMYFAWITALVGAEVMATLPEWRSGRRAVSPHHRRGDQLSLALAALVMLKQARIDGVGLRTKVFVKDLQADPIRMLAILEHLKDAKILSLGEDSRWVLARDLTTLSLHQLYRILGLSLTAPGGGKAPKVGLLVERLAQEEGTMLSQSVEDALKSIENPSAETGATPTVPDNSR